MAGTGGCSCEICNGGGLGLLGESSGVYAESYKGASASGGYGDIYSDYADYFAAYGNITGLNGLDSKRKLILRPGRPVVSETADYIPPALRKSLKSEPSPFYKKYDSGTSDIYAYRGRKTGMAKAFENTRVPKSDKLATPYVTGYDMRKRFLRRKRRVGFFITLPSLIVLLGTALALLITVLA